MNLSQVQVTRFYETLAVLIANREGVNIKVTVTPRKEKQHGAESRETHRDLQECKAV